MREKIQAGIILLTFSVTAAVHLAIIPAIVAFEMTHDSNIGFWVYVASVPTLTLPLAFLLVWLTSYTLDRIGYEGGEWVTVTKDNGTQKKVRIVPTIYKRGGERDHETEELFRQG